ncbi:ATP-dependent helicase [Pararhodobacter oceanensis]|uniref:DNA 3'-5' helicase n=1 Tax=Pararhodobacter oceanensis TaxID=2172121 RepID=A0A2T8HYA8_9RHOB|nr:UvrD-helicase domain-containing protein [Pararhodobacter oceanensis]PVH30423.1 DNA helicase II [Pararhodobacter oceanensis]
MSDDKSQASLSQQAMARAVAPQTARYLDGLNEAQRTAVEALDGPVLMLAGAGTGKTRALTARIAHLIASGKARPNEILAVTFTNKAAREMKYRIGQQLGDVVEGMPWLGTFHAIGVRFLRRHAELVGLKSNFTILDTDDQLRLLKQLIRANNLDEKRWPPRALAGLIDGWKNRAWRPEVVPGSEASAFDNRGTELYAAYQDRLRTLNACDFGDLLLHVVTILQQNPDILAQYQRWLRFILVDEYQDTNVAQYLLLRLLAQAHSNICCVGDDDQSIYGWRGAEVGNILRFERDFPGATVVRLEQNYRSTPHILAAASGVIAANEGRLGKTLWTEETEGQKVVLIGHWDGEDEARWIGEEIEALERGGRGLPPQSPDGMAILVRASHQMRAFEDRFLTIGLPYRVVGGPRFYERLEIRDAMAYFRLAISPTDDLAFERIVNMPKRGLGDKAQQTIQRVARENDVPLLLGAALVLRDGLLGGRGAANLREFIENMARWHDAVRNSIPGAVVEGDDDVIEHDGPTQRKRLSHIELAEQMLDESGYTAMWQAQKTPEAEGRLENLKELIKALEGFDNLQGFLEHVALIMDNETEDRTEKVTIMTLHAAKGLEFPMVFLPGWEDGLFPSQRSMDESGPKGLEEERRLAYVGITRAEKLCMISFAANRRVFGQWQSQLPSRFIDELPPEHVEIRTPPGLYGGAFGAAARQPEHSTMDDRAAKADVYNAPGWRRMQARGQKAPPQPKAKHPPAPDVHFTDGERVFHQKFGTGTVLAVDGDKLAVAFDRAGEKHIVARFVTPADGMDDVPF